MQPLIQNTYSIILVVTSVPFNMEFGYKWNEIYLYIWKLSSIFIGRRIFLCSTCRRWCRIVSSAFLRFSNTPSSNPPRNCWCNYRRVAPARTRSSSVARTWHPPRASWRVSSAWRSVESEDTLSSYRWPLCLDVPRTLAPVHQRPTGVGWDASWTWAEIIQYMHLVYCVHM